MKPLIIIGGMLLVFGANHAAMAQTCSGTRLTVTQISQLVSGRYACYGPGAWPAVEWNELHSGTIGSTTNTSGTVTDYKKGPTDPIDPTKPVGTFTIGQVSKNGAITYIYPSGSYGYYVYDNNLTAPNPGVYSFCTTGGGINIPVTVGSNTAHGGCP